MTHKHVDPNNALRADRSNYHAVLQTIVAEGNCPFCREHFDRHHPHPILNEDDFWIVTENGWPYAGSDKHFLLVSRRHIETINELSEQERLGFFSAIDRLASANNLSALTVLWRSGETSRTGASVAHLHAQVIVGYERTSESPPIMTVVGFGPGK